VNSLVDNLVQQNHYVELIGKEKTKEKLVNKLDPGDLIAYSGKPKNENNRYLDNDYGHLAMYLGNDKIACHTFCRSDQPDCTWGG
jgi:hypothetical protein